MSTDTERLSAAIGRHVRAIAARFRHLARPTGITRAEFMRTVRDRDLSHPVFYGPPTGCVDAEGGVKARLNKPEVSTEHAKATQACLPIGPCCC
jgi:hypothetical protein